MKENGICEAREAMGALLCTGEGRDMNTIE